MAEIVWSAALVALLGFEGYTIWWDRKKETTLSFFVIKLRANAAYRSALVGSFMWLAWHWFLEPDQLALRLRHLAACLRDRSVAAGRQPVRRRHHRRHRPPGQSVRPQPA